MILLNRLRLRDNWPLWVAIVMAALTIFSFLYSQKITKFSNPDTETVVYLLLIITNTYAFTGLVLVALLGVILLVGKWHLRKRSNLWANLIFWFTFLLHGLGCQYWFGISLFGNDISHEQSFEFKGDIYHLAEARISDPGIDYYVVYKCEDIGIFCHPTYTSNSVTFEDIELLTLYADPQQNRLYLQINSERFLVTP